MAKQPLAFSGLGVLGLILLLAGSPHNSWAQLGGEQAYSFLKLSPSARTSALGGLNVSLRGKDHATAAQNPALLNPDHHSQISLSVLNLVAGVNSGYASYAHHFESIGVGHGGIHYVNYGSMPLADELGNRLGTTTANELALFAGVSRQFGDRFSAGANFKLLYSNIAGHSSSAFALDFGGLYYHEEQDLGVGLSLRNIGVGFNPYSRSGQVEAAPFEIALGVTKRIPHTPFRLSLTVQNLERGRLAEENPNEPVQTDLQGNPIETGPSVADQVFRHLVFGMEVLISPNFHIRAAYNHQHRVDLQRGGQGFTLAGVTFGGGLRIRKFYLDYAYVNRNDQGGSHHLTLSTFLNYFGENPEPYRPQRSARNTPPAAGR